MYLKERKGYKNLYSRFVNKYFTNCSKVLLVVDFFRGILLKSTYLWQQVPYNTPRNFYIKSFLVCKEI